MDAKASRLRTRAQLRAMHSNLEYGIDKIPPQLYSHSKAYRTYLLSQRLPENAPRYEVDEQGRPIVHQGEYICRMREGHNAGPCGERRIHRYSLIEHIRAAHQQGTADRRAFCKSGGNRKDGLKAALQFYRKLMKDEDIVDEKTDDSRPAPALQALKEESDHSANREIIEIESSPEPEETVIKVESQIDMAPPIQRKIQHPAARGAKSKRKEEQNEQSTSDDELGALLKEVEAKKKKLQELELETLQIMRKLAARKKR